MTIMDSETDTELDLSVRNRVLSSGSSSSTDSARALRLPKRRYPWETKDWNSTCPWETKDWRLSWRANAAANEAESVPPSSLRTEVALHEKISRNEHQFQMVEAQWKHEKQRMRDEILSLQRVNAQLEETIEDKNAELASRPTHREIKLLRNEIDRVQDPRRDKTRKESTRELVQRDKTIYSINSERQKRKFPPLGEVPRKELHAFAAEVLSLLDVVDLREAERAVAKLCGVVQKSLPKMKSFAEDIFTATQAHDAKSAITLVRDWADDNKNYQAWLRFHADVRDVLTDAHTDLDSPKEVLDEIRDLKEFQAKVALGKEAYSFLSKDMKDNPKELCYNLIRHFMQLFDVREMEGVLPRMNTVFGRLNELRNFWKSLCVELRIDSTTSAIVVLQLLSSVRGPLGTGAHADAHM